MFFVRDLTYHMTLHPSFFNPGISEIIFNELLRAVEGTLQGDYYVICVFDNGIIISEGMVIPGTGRVDYNVNYKAICFKPFRGEVVDGFVTEAQSTGIFVEVGPMMVFISDSVSLLGLMWQK
jgi:DNA-directed RNA polymerase II subunit RPB7